MSITVSTFKERPELRQQVAAVANASWPEFMRHSAVTAEYRERMYEYFADLHFCLLDSEGTMLGLGKCVPLSWNGNVSDLPTGWDDVIARSVNEYEAGVQPTALSALSIAIAPAARGQGLAAKLIELMKQAARERQINHLIAPVRPTWKFKYPITPIDTYVRWTTPSGEPFDPWLRVHARSGAKFLKTAPESSLITGSVSDWEQWTGLLFPESGQYVIPDALTTLDVDVERGKADYREPNVWMSYEV